ncbi:hypothetical protein HAX54_038416, partial [Datura stramonium]|nr:hypothetical protein [Datura stramonium]
MYIENGQEENGEALEMMSRQIYGEMIRGPKLAVICKERSYAILKKNQKKKKR